MADNDMSFCQRAVIEFLVKEEIPAAEIHQRLQRAYGSVCMRQCLRMAGMEFYRRGIFKLPECWEKCVQRSGDYVEK